MVDFAYANSFFNLDEAIATARGLYHLHGKYPRDGYGYRSVTPMFNEPTDSWAIWCTHHNGRMTLAIDRASAHFAFQCLSDNRTDEEVEAEFELLCGGNDA